MGALTGLPSVCYLILVAILLEKLQCRSLNVLLTNPIWVLVTRMQVIVNTLIQCAFLFVRHLWVSSTLYLTILDLFLVKLLQADHFKLLKITFSLFLLQNCNDNVLHLLKKT